MTSTKLARIALNLTISELPLHRNKFISYLSYVDEREVQEPEEEHQDSVCEAS
jgi:hypothetical protein